MKTIIRTMLTTAVLLLMICLWIEASAFAKTDSGEAIDLQWTLNSTTDTLTITGNGNIEQTDLPGDWKENAFQVVLNGNIGFISGAMEELMTVDIVSNGPDGFSWHYSAETCTLTLSGNGNWPEEYQILYNLQTIIIEDGITGIDPALLYTKHLVIGKDANLLYKNEDALLFAQTVSGGFEVHPDNPHFASYKGSLYSKDFSVLLDAGGYPPYDFHSGLKVITGHSLHTSSFSYGNPIIFPWGTTALRKNSLNCSGVFILPDTLTEIDASVGDPIDFYNREIILSVHNESASKVFAGIPSNGDYPAETKVTVLDSAVEYYPGISEPVQPIKTGWQLADQTWYYFNAKGSRVTSSWIKTGEAWYWLREDGSMSTSEWIDWHGARYRTSRNGVMYFNNWALVGDKWYWFRASGDMTRDQWIRGKDGKWYYLSNDGSMASSRWIYGKDRKWYYVGSDGVMLTNTRTPDGYYVDANGAWIQ